MDKTLFTTKFLALIDREGYVFSREVRCNGQIVVLLPFQRVNEEYQFLARIEVCPAHGPDSELCSITGGVDEGETLLQTALHELREEAGYDVHPDEFISLGEARPTKSTDTTMYLYGIDVTGRSQGALTGDGTRWEEGASVRWVSYEQGLHIQDPSFTLATSRLLNILKK